MSNLNPHIKIEAVSSNCTKFIIAPLNRGMGTTLGNAIRRVLLSALSGIAATGIKITGANHEFATLPNVLEDVLDIVFNIKGIVFAGDISSDTTLNLSFSGKGKITAANIQCVDGISVVNTDHYIAELTEEGKFEIDFYIEKGVGYRSSEQNIKPDQDAQLIYLDSTFSPVVRVNHSVENIRVGKELDYESLVVEVETNGSISPENAIKNASQILNDLVFLFSDLEILEKPVSQKQKAVILTKESEASSVVSNLSIDDLELSARSSNCLKKAGVLTVGQLLEKEHADLIQIKNFGKKSADEINGKLKQYGVALREPLLEEVSNEA